MCLREYLCILFIIEIQIFELVIILTKLFPSTNSVCSFFLRRSDDISHEKLKYSERIEKKEHQLIKNVYIRHGISYQKEEGTWFSWQFSHQTNNITPIYLANHKMEFFVFAHFWFDCDFFFHLLDAISCSHDWPMILSSCFIEKKCHIKTI